MGAIFTIKLSVVINFHSRLTDVCVCVHVRHALMAIPPGGDNRRGLVRKS